MSGRVRVLQLLCSLAFVPPLLAQRGTAGGMGRGAHMPGKLLREPGIVIPKLVNAVNLLVEHRTDLALSDSQFKQVIFIKRTLDSTNSPFSRKLDSLERLFRGGPIFADPSRERLDSIAEGRLLARQITADIHDNNIVYRDKAYALLNAQQLSRIQEMEGKAEQAILDEERKKKP
jgi:hypothetical protein